jgi:hypothetical protein
MINLAQVQISLRGPMNPGDKTRLLQAVSEILHLPVEQVALYQSLNPESDAELWGRVHQSLTEQEALQLGGLMQKSDALALSPTDRQALASLVEKTQQQMLERSQALEELQTRGYDIRGYLGLRPQDEKA